MKDLQERTIRFGQTHRGKKFHTLVQYCSWFIGHWGESTKEEHREFLHFFHMYTEHMEKSKEMPAPKSKTDPYQGTQLPKAKAASKMHHGLPPDSGKSSHQKIEEEFPSDSEWSEVQVAFQQSARMDQMANRMNQVEQNMQDRMNNIEGALTLIVSQLQQLGLQPNSPQCQ